MRARKGGVHRCMANMCCKLVIERVGPSTVKNGEHREQELTRSCVYVLLDRPF